MTELATVPQPWETDFASREEFMTFALKEEADGATLVVRSLHDAYPAESATSWVVGTMVLTEWRTGKELAVLTDDSDDLGYDNVIVVENIWCD